MDCEINPLSCQIADVAEAIGQPTGWEIAGVIVAGIAALGTLAIAWINIRLIRKQHELSKDLADTEARRLRGEYASKLGDELGSMMAARISGSDWKMSDRNEIWAVLNSLGARTGEKTWKKFNSCVSNIVLHSRISSTDPERFFEVQEILGDRYTAWVEDPSTTDFELPDFIAEIRKSGTELAYWYR